MQTVKSLYLHSYMGSLIKLNSPMELTSRHDAHKPNRILECLTSCQCIMVKRTRQKIAEENLIVHFECKLKQIHIKLLKMALSFFASCQKMKVFARHANAKIIKGPCNTDSHFEYIYINIFI